jgi:RNA polymerase sigma factor (sigma-70 family)
MASVQIEAPWPRGSATPASWEGDPQAAPDEQLLDRVLTLGESEAEEAFQALVRRHGPMVLGVCRHILGQVHDAEDAFQATFLVLARKAGTIRDRRVLGCWLYEVAYRIAVRAKTHAVRRRSRERQGAEVAAVAPAGDQDLAQDLAWAELRPVLHEEVNRLPEKYRSAVVLCYLEGRTNEEAAALLRWPVGTVKGRLSRARELLRSRLARRGLALSAAFLMARLAQGTAFAEEVPARLYGSTARHAVRAARGGSAASADEGAPGRADELADEALRERPDRTSKALARGSLAALALKLLLIAFIVSGAVTVLASAADAPPGPARFLLPFFGPAAAGGGCHTLDRR